MLLAKESTKLSLERVEDFFRDIGVEWFEGCNQSRVVGKEIVSISWNLNKNLIGGISCVERRNEI